MKPIVTLTIVVSLIAMNATGQISASKLLTQAKKQKEKADYSPAIKNYKEALKLDPENEVALADLVEIYLYHYQIYDSAQTYIDRQLVLFDKTKDYSIYFDQANCLRMREKHEDAIFWYKKYLNEGIVDEIKESVIIQEVQRSITSAQNALTHMDIVGNPYEVENMDFFINSRDAEYTPVYFENQNLLLYNARYKDYDNERMDADNLYFENIYYFDLEESVASTYNPDIEQTTHQSVVGRVSESDSILVFYQNKLWVSSFTADRLNGLAPLPEVFGTFYYQPHGVFSSDQKTFIFSARAEEGNLDLYVSKKSAGTWSVPSPVGDHINSDFDEDAPFLSADETKLYFSSKGHNSSGGYDFFVSELKDGKWSKPINLGYPMNSAGDDIYISWNKDEESGYFSSNRIGGFGGMDIYSFGLARKTIKGIVSDKEGNLIVGATIEIINSDSGEIQIAQTNEQGEYSFLISPEQKYSIKGSKEGYYEVYDSLLINTNEQALISNLSLDKNHGISLFFDITDAQTGQSIENVKVTVIDLLTKKQTQFYTSENGNYSLALQNIKLNDQGSYDVTIEKEGYLITSEIHDLSFNRAGDYPIQKDLQPKVEKNGSGIDLAKVIEIDPIYFDLGKYKIRKDAAEELDKVVQIMNDNPNIIIELGAYTDARGSKRSNQTLSDKRAKASVDYIRSRIENPNRITGKGYGESKLVNNCTDGINCPENQHQANRRTEFIIVEM